VKVFGWAAMRADMPGSASMAVPVKNRGTSGWLRREERRETEQRTLDNVDDDHTKNIGDGILYRVCGIRNDSSAL
jgi:hypothetical protein